MNMMVTDKGNWMQHNGSGFYHLYMSYSKGYKIWFNGFAARTVPLNWVML